jgi:uncharacterized protein (DUF1800 family)
MDGMSERLWLMGSLRLRRHALIAAIAAGALTACNTIDGTPRADGATSSVPVEPQHYAFSADEEVQLLNRVTWGASPSSARELKTIGVERYLAQQLRPGPAVLPAEVSARIDAMTISQRTPQDIAYDFERERRDGAAIADPDQKKAAQQSYQREMTQLAREAATRSLLRAIYSSNQLQEQMTWFWMNHFNVFQYKANIRILLGDFEEHAIRDHALGRFRDLLAATVYHPAMLRYLDNEQSAAGRINENYARELMELHTLGVDGGYTQHDVQELARVLTGLGVNMTGNRPFVRVALQTDYVRNGLFEFNPNRHDYGDKVLLGHTIRGRGLAEVDEAIDLLARHPSTARFVSRKLAVFFCADEPPPELIERMARRFQATDGDIAATLATLFASPEFRQSLGRKFKDPVHYVVSALRYAYDDKPILNADPVINWIARMGEPLYGHQTPDGYPLSQDAWASPGQMTTRFEIARTIGYGNPLLFRSSDPTPVQRAAFPQAANALYFDSLQKTLGPATQQALEAANSPQEWNLYLLASPEFMNR